jgi:hypothetical protein
VSLRVGQISSSCCSLSQTIQFLPSIQNVETLGSLRRGDERAGRRLLKSLHYVPHITSDAHANAMQRYLPKRPKSPPVLESV